MAAAVAANPPDMTETKFIFSPEQAARATVKADQGSRSDGRSMWTTGKTSNSTHLQLQIAQEKIAALKLALQLHHIPSMILLLPDGMDDKPEAMETNEEPCDAHLLGAALSSPVSKKKFTKT
jgi:hypothetical protein